MTSFVVLLSRLKPSVPILLINNEVVLDGEHWDYSFIGDCDVTVQRLCKDLNWTLPDGKQPNKL